MPIPMQVLNIEEFSAAMNALVLERAKELIADNAALKKLIVQLQPYIRDLNAENYEDPSVGIYMDRTLESLAAEVEVICNNLQPV